MKGGKKGPLPGHCLSEIYNQSERVFTSSSFASEGGGKPDKKKNNNGKMGGCRSI